MTATQRIVTSELMQQLDPVERIIAQLFVSEGKWKLQETDDE